MKAKITRKEVFAILENYWNKSGKIPTQHEIRRFLGDKGSFGTINKYTNEWKKRDENEDKKIPERLEKLPIELYKLVCEFYTSIKISVEESEDSERVSSLEEENINLRNEIQSLRDEIMSYQELKGEMTAYKQTQSELIKTIQKESQEKEQMKAQINKLEEILKSFANSKTKQSKTQINLVDTTGYRRNAIEEIT